MINVEMMVSSFLQNTGTLVHTCQSNNLIPIIILAVCIGIAICFAKAVFKTILILILCLLIIIIFSRISSSVSFNINNDLQGFIKDPVFLIK